jgi:hypothetical protein
MEYGIEFFGPPNLSIDVVSRGRRRSASSGCLERHDTRLALASLYRSDVSDLMLDIYIYHPLFMYSDVTALRCAKIQ